MCAAIAAYIVGCAACALTTCIHGATLQSNARESECLGLSHTAPRMRVIGAMILLLFISSVYAASGCRSYLAS